MKRIMLGVSCMAILFSAPRFFEVSTQLLCQADAQCTPQVVRTALPRSRLYWTLYHILLGLLFVTVGPCVLLCGLTVRISVALRRATRRRRSLCQLVSDKAEDGRPLWSKSVLL